MLTQLCIAGALGILLQIYVMLYLYTECWKIPDIATHGYRTVYWPQSILADSALQVQFSGSVTSSPTTPGIRTPRALEFRTSCWRQLACIDAEDWF